MAAVRLPGIVTEETGLDSDDWYTPPYIFEALGNLVYDLDPCSPPASVVPWIRAIRRYSETQDGLSQPWRGRVWLNPPYSDPAPWVRRLVEHGNGIALIQADTSTVLWHEVAPKADAVCFILGRVKFVQGDRTGPARFASALLAFGESNASAVRRSNLGWCP